MPCAQWHIRPQRSWLVLHGAPKLRSLEASGDWNQSQAHGPGITNSVSLSVTYLGQWQHLGEKLASSRISSCYRSRYLRYYRSRGVGHSTLTRLTDKSPRIQHQGARVGCSNPGAYE